MPNARQTRTNAADSAPGVDDGPTSSRPSSSRSATPGRTVVWVLVALSLLALLAIFLMRPMNEADAPAAATGPAPSASNPAAPPSY